MTLSEASRTSALTPFLRSRRGRRTNDRFASGPVTRQPRGCAACLRLALLDPVGSSGERRGECLQAKPGVFLSVRRSPHEEGSATVSGTRLQCPLRFVVPALGSMLRAQAPFATLSGPVPLEGRREPQLASLLRSKLPQGALLPPSDRKRSSGRRATLSAHKRSVSNVRGGVVHPLQAPFGEQKA